MALVLRNPLFLFDFSRRSPLSPLEFNRHLTELPGSKGAERIPSVLLFWLLLVGILLVESINRCVVGESSLTTTDDPISPPRQFSPLSVVASSLPQ